MSSSPYRIGDVLTLRIRRERRRQTAYRCGCSSPDGLCLGKSWPYEDDGQSYLRQETCCTCQCQLHSMRLSRMYKSRRVVFLFVSVAAEGKLDVRHSTATTATFPLIATPQHPIGGILSASKHQRGHCPAGFSLPKEDLETNFFLRMVWTRDHGSGSLQLTTIAAAPTSSLFFFRVVHLP